MSSNGYVRRCCPKCIFYQDARDFGIRCSLYKELWGDCMLWVSALDYDSNVSISLAHDEPCEHFVSLIDVKNEKRQSFGIDYHNN